MTVQPQTIAQLIAAEQPGWGHVGEIAQRVDAFDPSFRAGLLADDAFAIGLLSTVKDQDTSYAAVARTQAGLTIFEICAPTGSKGSIEYLRTDVDDVAQLLEVLTARGHEPTEKLVEGLIADDMASLDGLGTPGCACCEGGVDIVAHVDAMIEDSGVGLQPVLALDTSPGFLYTIGLSEKGGADVIFVGDGAPPVLGYLDGVIDAMMHGEPVETGLQAPGSPLNDYDVPMWIIEADDKLATHAIGVGTRLERIGSDATPRLLQVVMPDREGRFPWDQGYAWLDQGVSERPSAPTTLVVAGRPSTTAVH